MRDLIENYLKNNGENRDFKDIFKFYTTKFYKKDNQYILEFPKWKFKKIPKPTFTSQEIENSLKNELIITHTDIINNFSLSNEEKTSLINKLSNFSLEELQNYTLNN